MYINKLDGNQSVDVSATSYLVPTHLKKFRIGAQYQPHACMQRHGLWFSGAAFLGPFSGGYRLVLPGGLRLTPPLARQQSSMRQPNLTHTRSLPNRTLPSVTPTFPMLASRKLGNTCLRTPDVNKPSLENVTMPTLSALPSHPFTTRFETKEQLYNYLQIVIKIWQARGRVPHKIISKLIDHHSFQKNLQSTRSFNILINLSLRSRAFSKASSLFKEMHGQGVEANMYTFALHIRQLVLGGAFSDAVSLAIREGPSFNAKGPMAHRSRAIASHSEAQVPDAIWNELLWAPSYILRADPRRNWASLSRRSVTYGTHTTAEHMLSKDTTMYPIPMSMIPLNMLNTALAHTPAHIVERLVVMLLSHHCPWNEGGLEVGQSGFPSCWQSPSQQLAVHITEQYIKSLPKDLPRNRSRIMRVINHHFRTNPIPGRPSPFPPPSLAIHRKHRDLLNHFMSLRSAMHPNDETLPLLLFSLVDGTSESAMRAIALHHDFERNWGDAEDGVITVKSRRIVVSIALRHGVRFKTFIRRQMRFMETEWKRVQALNFSSLNVTQSPRSSWREDHGKIRQEWSRFCNLRKRIIRKGIMRAEELQMNVQDMKEGDHYSIMPRQ